MGQAAKVTGSEERVGAMPMGRVTWRRLSGVSVAGVQALHGGCGVGPQEPSEQHQKDLPVQVQRREGGRHRWFLLSLPGCYAPAT